MESNMPEKDCKMSDPKKSLSNGNGGVVLD